MYPVFQAYPYLVVAVAVVTIQVLLLLRAFPRQRRASLLGSALAAPASLCGLWMVPEYWDPRRIAVWHGVGLEDLLFTCGVGGTAWLAAAWAAPGRVAVRWKRPVLLRRLLIVFAAGIVGAPLLVAAGFRWMDAALAVLAGLGLFLGTRLRPGMRTAVLGGAFVWTAGYAVALLAAGALWPDLSGWWSASNVWGIRFAGFPVEELAWAFLYPGACAASVAYMLDAGLETAGRPSASPRPRAAGGRKTRVPIGVFDALHVRVRRLVRPADG